MSIEFKDSGCGIETSSLARIFDPLFTTKKSRAGLGLAVCSRIVERHGGEISVESCLGEGTTVEIRLPAESSEEGGK